ncbi:tyrosinase family protein [Ensifer sp. ENS06]|uniref:tyrosinase family protein n=1 Tax=Ensifer sp. ENS06 TaxID=2769276 RepID=UPI001783381A|nr:tyrosinase family protein [Ensifer sp. ENS06]MBD9628015.1 tyrosinase family protein [Ensifer sp. ENS06]
MDKDELIEHPTFLEHIRFFFEPIDIEHMQARGIDLATYEGVKRNTTSIHSQTKSGSMPPEPGRRWTAKRVKTFRNWILDGFPMGSAPKSALTAMSALARATPNARRDIDDLSVPEIERLALAFRTIMNRDPAHPQSYFALADIHWFPEPVNCLHHEERYNPWHRIFIDRFEAALQSVPGCEDLKMPYWDVVKRPHSWLFQPPFDSYTFQCDAAPQYPAGTRTVRYPADKIHDNMTSYDVAGTIKEALAAPKFERFASGIEQAHDDGHVSCGPAMRTPDIAAFDPIFWFFHTNWERMWWSWQHRHSAVTLEAFRQTLEGSDFDWLDTPPFNELPPFAETASQAIDATKYVYEESPLSLFKTFARVEAGNISADQVFRVQRRSRLSVRVKGIARLAVPGSFNVHLMADGKSVARHAFFQGTEPGRCPSCVRRETVNIDLRVDRAAIVGKALSVRIEALSAEKDRWISLSEVGAPTINIRELLTAE